MRDYIIRRLLLLIPIMILVSFMTHATFRVIPGSAAHLICQFQCTDETVAAIEGEYGLDEDFFRQYGEWLGAYPDDDRGSTFDYLNPGDYPDYAREFMRPYAEFFGIGDDGKSNQFHGVFQFEFGESFLNRGETVTDRLSRTLPVTIELMILSLLFAVILGIPPGVLSAIRPGTPADWIVRLTSVAWLSVPNFYLAILVITFGQSWFGWTPPNFGTGEAVGFFTDPIENLKTFFFPSLVLSLAISAVIMRLTRSSMLEVMRNDYVRTAWSKGLRERAVVWRHALKNAMIPVLTIIGLQVGGLIGGSVLIESVFALNGMGNYLLVSVIGRDLLVVQSLVLIFALVFVLVNLVVDVSYAWLDPRIRYG
ncbi:MAG TPA: ABC transporter permease [Dehalococcoidia bacterium]